MSKTKLIENKKSESKKVNYIKYDTFKEKYDNDEMFKAKHQKYVLEKLKCDCGCMVTRSNMSNHLKTNKHIKLVNQINKQKEERKQQREEKKQEKELEIREKEIQVKIEEPVKQLSNIRSIVLIIDGVVYDLSKIIDQKADAKDNI
jgi:hypothetical protein